MKPDAAKLTVKECRGKIIFIGIRDRDDQAYITNLGRIWWEGEKDWELGKWDDNDIVVSDLSHAGKDDKKRAIESWIREKVKRPDDAGMLFESSQCNDITPLTNNRNLANYISGSPNIFYLSEHHNGFIFVDFLGGDPGSTNVVVRSYLYNTHLK